jgi:hypothetical protein
MYRYLFLLFRLLLSSDSKNRYRGRTLQVKNVYFENVRYSTGIGDWLDHITLDCVYSLGRRSFGHLAKWTSRLDRCQLMLSNGKSSILVTARRMMRSTVSIWWRDSSATREIAAPSRNTSLRDCSAATEMRITSRSIQKNNCSIWD